MAMFWAWALGSFAVWLGLGSMIWRNLPTLKAKLATFSRRARVLGGTALLFLSAALLLGGLYGLLSRADPNGALTTVQWLVILIVGAIFVVCQALAAAVLFSVVDPGVTKTASSASIHTNLEGKEL